MCLLILEGTDILFTQLCNKHPKFGLVLLHEVLKRTLSNTTSIYHTARPEHVTHRKRLGPWQGRLHVGLGENVNCFLYVAPWARWKRCSVSDHHHQPDGGMQDA